MHGMDVAHDDARLGLTPIPVELAHALVDLDRSDVEVVWMTSWHERANWLLEAVGIDTVLRCTDSESTRRIAHLKWMVVSAESARDGAPFVWIDDVEIDPQTWRWASTLDVPSMLIRTNRYHGLTTSTRRGVLRWLQDFAAADVSGLRDSVPIEGEPQERAR